MLPHKISQSYAASTFSSYPIICHSDLASFALKAGRHQNKVQTEFPVNKLRLCLRLKTSSQINISQERTRRRLSFSWASNTLSKPTTPDSHSSFCARRAVNGCYATNLQNRCLVTRCDPEIKEAINPIMHWEEVKRHRGEDEIPDMKSGLISYNMYLPLCLTSCSAPTCNHSTQR